jgi:multiple sugar transport system permease protein
MTPGRLVGLHTRLRRATWRGQRIDWSGYLFVLPFFTFFMLFTAGAITFGVGLSFTEWGIVGEMKWVGLDNFREIFTDELAVKAFLNTFRYAAVIVPGVTILAFLFALFVHQRWPGHAFARVAFFAPYVCAATVIGLIWVWLLDTHFGLINLYLGKLGIPPVPWLTSTRWSWVGVSITSIWWDLGFSFVLLLAGLQEVPPELIEAALIDGANRLQSLWHVTLPLLRPVISMVVVLQTISTLRIFSQVVVMTAGGPAASSTSVIHYLYAYGLTRGRFGYAAAIAMMLFVVTLVVTLLYRRLMKESVE